MEESNLSLVKEAKVKGHAGTGPAADRLTTDDEDRLAPFVLL